MSADLVDAGGVLVTRYAGPSDPAGPNVQVQINAGDQSMSMTLAQWVTLVLSGYSRLIADLESPGELVTKEALVASMEARSRSAKEQRPL